MFSRPRGNRTAVIALQRSAYKLCFCTLHIAGHERAFMLGEEEGGGGEVMGGASELCTCSMQLLGMSGVRGLEIKAKFQ